MHAIPFRNSLPKNLAPEILTRLSLRRVEFEVGHELEFPGNSLHHLFFVEEGMASMTTTFEDGSQVEVTMFGYESIVGVSALMGTKQSFNRVYTQIAGYGYAAPIGVARREFASGGAFQSLALRYVQAQLLQAMQSAGCNASHSVDQRLARWLLLCADRVHSSTFKISQEFLAQMLGLTRPSVSMAAGLLKEREVIEYNRGVIHILDLVRLEARACECYGVIKHHLDNYAEFDSGIVG